MAITNSRRWPFSFFFPLYFFLGCPLLEFLINACQFPVWIVRFSLIFSFTDRSSSFYIFLRPPFSTLPDRQLSVLVPPHARLDTLALTSRTKVPVFYLFHAQKRTKKKTNEISFLRNVAALPPPPPSREIFKMTNTLTVWACINILLCIYNKQRKMLINLT
jgi:hypothetical protein